MPSNPHLSTPQIAALFDEIARAAELADDICYYRPDTIEEPDQVEAIIDTLRMYVRRIGWLADRGSAGIGGEPLRGSPDERLMSPDWVHLQNQALQKPGGSDAQE
ncbi:MAG: hypothetical protein J0H09_04030 [Burkholderiales bacterium]|nr:hypothetical protein [Burkholderiales bacterium]ODU52914.1 MAG: hypothetical protein ABT09_02295 [bacterium SCN 57-13]